MLAWLFLSTRRDALRAAALPLAVALPLRLAARLSRAVRLWGRAERLPPTSPPRTCIRALSFHALGIAGVG